MIDNPYRTNDLLKPQAQTSPDSLSFIYGMLAGASLACAGMVASVIATVIVNWYITHGQ